MLSFFFLGKNLNNEVEDIPATHNKVESRVNLRIFLFVSKWLPRIASFSRSTSSAPSRRRSITISMTHAIVIRESPTSSTSFICINIELRTVVLLFEVETVLNCGEQWLEICGIYDSLCLSRCLIKNSLFERERKKNSWSFLLIVVSVRRDEMEIGKIQKSCNFSLHISLRPSCCVFTVYSLG